MGAMPNPRQAVKELLEGRVPSRPLFLPIVFSLGARIENVPLRTFLSNPTKIASALRQVRAHLAADGVTCYFDPFLEAEALGGTLHWETEDGPPELRWPGRATRDRLPAAMRSPELAAHAGRIPVAVEVIRRMKDAVRESALLMAGLSGPLALASRLRPSNESGMGASGPMTARAVETAGAALAEIARALLEAGAEVILIQERIPAGLAAELVEEGMSQLQTAINIIRFYEALPVLLLSAGDARGPLAACGGAASACIVCSEWNEAAGAGMHELAGAEKPICGIAFPANAFDGVECAGADAGLAQTARELQPAIVTTAGDVSRIANLKRLAQLREALEG
jgi:uroporphyrinogen-III decarboxylase